MQKLQRKKVEVFTVRRTELKPIPPVAERTPLGRRLMELVAEIDASDEPPMSEEDIERRLQSGRGGFDYSVGLDAR